MIKVLLVGMSPNYGGIEAYLFNLVKNSDKEIFQFDILASDNKIVAFENEMIKMGCKVYHVPSRNKYYFKHLKELKKIFNNNYNVVHFNIMSYSWFEPIFLAYKKNKSIIIHSHSASFGNNVSKKTKILNYIGKILCKLIKTYNVSCGIEAGKFMFNGKFEIFNNGIDVEKYLYSLENRNDIRKKLKISKNTKIIGIVARLEIQKNIEFLVDIFNEIIKINQNYKLIIVGSGTLENNIKSRIHEYNIDDKIILTGTISNVNEMLSVFDIYVMPSLYEGLSISLIEAQVNGLKCYTSDKVDKTSNITGNVEFVSLDKNAKFWANKILAGDNNRDIGVLKKIPSEFFLKNSNEKVYNYYRKICGEYDVR